jgi:hypothetical protein
MHEHDIDETIETIDTIELEHDARGGHGWGSRSTSQMIDDCFRHQHPEAYGRPQVAQVAVPWELECGRDHMSTSATAAVPEEAMGAPDAVPLDVPRS